MSRFSNTVNYDLGTLTSRTRQRSTFLRDNRFENDIYEFDTTSTRNINISLHDLATGDDADLRLYEDTNSNGILDSSDLQLASSVRSGNNNDTINYRGSAGTYFARVSYFSSQADSRIDYELDLTADFRRGSSTIAAIEDYGTSLVGDAAAVETGRISNRNTSDTYALSVFSNEVYDITLSGLSNDADLRVIEDENNNGIVDAGEIYASSTRGGSRSDTVTIDDAGDYFVEVYQYRGSTDYTLQIDQDFV
ncbi:MAG: PPC domain-containing protein [Cyanobacteria bacterium J06623_7]